MHLLVATGGSYHSEIAVRAGLNVARTLCANVTLLYVVRKPDQRAQAQRVLAALADRWANGSINPTCSVGVGRVLPILFDELNKQPTDLLVLGERLPHRLLTRMKGSIVSRVASSAPCPVLIAKQPDMALRRVLICDSDPAPPTIFDGLEAHGMMPLLRHAQITVLHVMSQISAAPGIPGQQLRAGADELMRLHAPEGELLARDIDLLQRHDLSASAKVRHGLAVDEILAEAIEGNYDQIIIGGHRTGGWPALLLDDLAHEIITRLDRSLLVIR